MEKITVNGTPFIAGRWPLDSALHTIIFIHGAAGSKMFWKEQVEGLADCCNTVALDLPGHGDSGKEGTDNIEAYAAVVEEFIRDAGIKSPVPCGLSMGGAIVQRMLIDGNIGYPGGIVVNSGARLKVMPAIFEMIQSNYSGYLASLPVMGASDKCDRERLAGIIEDAGMSRPVVTYNDFTACNNFDVTDKLGEINKPVLVLAAEEDKLSPVKYGKFLHEKISGSAFVNISGAGHFSPVEKPDDVNSAIRSFISGL